MYSLFHILSIKTNYRLDWDRFKFFKNSFQILKFLIIGFDREDMKYTLFVYLMFNLTGKTAGQCSLFSSLITAVLGHFKKIIAPILQCEIDDKMNEQSLRLGITDW